VTLFESWTSAGSLFHTVGAAILKARALHTVRDLVISDVISDGLTCINCTGEITMSICCNFVLYTRTWTIVPTVCRPNCWINRTNVHNCVRVYFTFLLTYLLFYCYVYAFCILAYWLGERFVWYMLYHYLLIWNQVYNCHGIFYVTSIDYSSMLAQDQSIVCYWLPILTVKCKPQHVGDFRSWF